LVVEEVYNKLMEAENRTKTVAYGMTSKELMRVTVPSEELAQAMKKIVREAYRRYDRTYNKASLKWPSETVGMCLPEVKYMIETLNSMADMMYTLRYREKPAIIYGLAPATLVRYMSEMCNREMKRRFTVEADSYRRLRERLEKDNMFTRGSAIARYIADMLRDLEEALKKTS